MTMRWHLYFERRQIKNQAYFIVYDKFFLLCKKE